MPARERTQVLSPSWFVYGLFSALVLVGDVGATSGPPTGPPNAGQAPVAIQSLPRPPHEPTETPAYVPGELLIQFRPGTPVDARGAIRARISARTLHTFRMGAEHWALGSGLDTLEAIRRLSADPSVLYAEPNYILYVDAGPNDPRYPELYGLHNTGQTGGTPGADIRAETAWDVITGGSEVLVAVIDTGVDYGHPDLADNIWVNPDEIPGNGIDDDGNGYVDDVRGWDFINRDNDPYDDHGHGTHVAGTIGAVGNNALGVAGVCWLVKILPVKFLGADGYGTTAGAISSIEYATLMGADLSNNSWGGGGFSLTMLAAINAAADAGSLFVAAAGNDSSNNDVYPHYPSSYDAPNVVSVAATDHNDMLAWFSNYGPTSVDLGAPGVSTLSTVPGSGYGFKSGTSMATPHVSGVAALLRALSPAITVADLKSRLLQSTDPIPALQGITVSGGRLNAHAAVSDYEGIAPAGVADLTVEAVATTTVSLVWTAPGDDGADGRASAYDLRYATSPLTEESFEAAMRVQGTPAPQPSGTTERTEARGLLARQTYFFALEAVDDWGNLGPLSNVVSATTLPGTPDIQILGDQFAVESTQTYDVDGARTSHSLPIATPPAGGGTLDLTADGDFGFAGETATATAEGLTIGQVGPTGTDCTPARGSFPIGAADLASLAADGTVHVDVQNSYEVGAFCSINRHQVRLNYRGLATELDFGPLFVGARRELGLVIENRGDDVLEVASISSDLPVFTPSAPALTLPAGGSSELLVAFQPASAEVFQGTLRIQSNDPDEGDLTVSLRGEGLVAPDIEVAPLSFSESLFSGQTATRTLSIRNTGGSDLTVALSAETIEAPSGAPQEPGGGEDATSGEAGPEETGGAPTPLAGPGGPGPLVSPFTFRDGFEDGDFAGWQLAPSSASREVTNATAARGTYSYHEFNSPGYQHFGGIYQVFGAVQPTYAGFYVRSGDAAQHGGYFVLREPGGLEGIFFYAKGTGRFYVNADVGGDESYVYAAQTWYHVEFKNIDFATKRFDYYVNGTLVKAQIPFRYPGSVQEFYRLDLYNYDPGAQAWWDEIVVSTREPTSWLRLSQESVAIPPGGSQDITATFDAVGLDGGVYDARIRIESNDPDEVEVDVPAHLDVTGVPDIALHGERVVVESVQSYTYNGARTQHDLTTPLRPSGPGTLDLVADGDYGDSYEIATASAEGLTLGQVGNTGTDCTPATGALPIAADDLARLAADGVVHVDVQNSYDVDVFCSVNRHRVRLTYNGPADVLDFGEVFLGRSRAITIAIENQGTETLNVSSIAADLPEFTVSPSSLTIPLRTSRDVTVTFSPVVDRLFEGTLTLRSDDPDEGTLTVALRGTGVVPPDIAVTPGSLSGDLFTGQTSVQSLTLSNAGGSDLIWRLDLRFASASSVLATSPEFSSPPAVPPAKDFAEEPPAPPGTQGLYVQQMLSTAEGEAPAPGALGAAAARLEDLLRELNGKYGSITAVIPNRYDFFEGVSGTYIGDGGNDMYDGGNFLSTDLGGFIPYSDNAIIDSSVFGLGGRYFTRKYPGLFVLVADIQGVAGFTISGNLGADGYGSVDAAVLETVRNGLRYRGFVKRVFAAYDPSVNHLIVVEGAPGVTHEFSTDTNNDYHRVSNLTQIRRIYYLLYAGAGGSYIDNAATQTIMNAFLDTLPVPWLSTSPTSGTVPPGGSQTVDARLDASGLPGGDYEAEIAISSNDPDEPEVAVPVRLHVTGVPDITVTGQAVVLESVQTYTTSGASTFHSLRFPIPPAGDGSLELVADGDYGDYGETATATAEGVFSASVGQTGSDCTRARGTFLLAASQLATLSADGVANVTVQNSYYVDAFCPVNQHRVLLSYQGPADRLDFGRLFLGRSQDLRILVRNDGTDVLHVRSISSNNPDFTVRPDALTLPAGGSQELVVTFAPSAPGLRQGTLTLSSDDPDEGELGVQLQGEGLVPPDISVSPVSLSERLNSGQTSTRVLTIGNDGGSDLEFQVRIGNSSSESATAATALIVQDVPPWGLTSNQQVLSSHRIVFDVAPASALPSTSLFGYKLVIIASDQPTSFYSALAQRAQQLEDYVAGGGVLEFHAAGWGYSYGDASRVTLPGGMRVNYYLSYLNRVVSPSHPIVAAVPNPFFGSSASHSYFTNVPPGATAIAADDQGRTNLVIYTHGLGTVVAGGQTFEYGYARGESAGTILANMIPYAHDLAPDWLHLDRVSGSVPAGGSMDLAVQFDATQLIGGDFAQTLLIQSNDPDEPRVFVPVSLHVTGVPDIRIRGEEIQVESSSAYFTREATTYHDLPVALPPEGSGELLLVANGEYGDVGETATVTAEGNRIGEVGATGTDCTEARDTFVLDAPTLSRLAADGVIHVTVQNSAYVDPICGLNDHRVRITYHGSADSLDFGPVFIGLSREIRLSVENEGTDVLEVTSISADLADFAPSAATLSIPRRGSRDLTLVFAPGAAGNRDARLAIRSNDPDEGEVLISLHGVGVVPPEIAVSPGSLSETLLIGDVRTRQLSVGNVGGSDLTWELGIDPASRGRVVSQSPRFGAPPSLPPGKEVTTAAPDPPRPQDIYRQEGGGEGGLGSPASEDPRLEDLLDVLNAEFGRINGIIPLRFDFDGGDVGFYIEDGGNDMYDGGNFLGTNLGGSIPYSDNRIVGSSFLGARGRYFTRKYPGLFVLAADLDGVSEFTISGNLGADGYGIADGAVLETVRQGVTYRGFVKRVFAAYGDPSVNHLVIVADDPSVVHEFSMNTNDDYHRLRSLTQSRRLYYLLYAGTKGVYIDNAATQAILDAFVSLLSAPWLTASPASGTVSPDASAVVSLDFSAAGLTKGGHDAEVVIRSNDFRHPRVTVPIHLDVIRLLADAGPGRTVECDGGEKGTVTLDGSASRHAFGTPNITLYQWMRGEESLGSGAQLEARLPMATSRVTLTIVDNEGDTSSDDTEVTVVDRASPAGEITYPPQGACLGPAALPARVLDSYADLCSPSLGKLYDPPGDPVFYAHGDHTVSLTVSDPSGNTAAPGSVAFTIDTVLPEAVILVDRQQWDFPNFLPFNAFMSTSDADGAGGGVVHESIAVDGCVVFDGLTYGDQDGVLLDEVVYPNEDTACRLVRLCGRRTWTNPLIEVRATDCGGNTRVASMTKEVDFVVSMARCP